MEARSGGSGGRERTAADTGVAIRVRAWCGTLECRRIEVILG
jgi:hypothetical protein